MNRTVFQNILIILLPILLCAGCSGYGGNKDEQSTNHMPGDDDAVGDDDSTDSDVGDSDDDSTDDDVDNGADTADDDATDDDISVEEPTLITSSEGRWWVIGEVSEGGQAPNVTVDETDVQQDWHGFGGTFNEAGWDALLELSEADRDMAVRYLFDPVEGCGFTYGRIPIGANDYSMDRYTLNEKANDFEMNNFSIERDQQLLIPYIKAALDVKPDIKFWASPWTPPTWMKVGADANGFDKGSMSDDPQMLDAHALYLARFVEEYADEGIVIESVQPQNEPGWQPDYPSCGWTDTVMADYIANHLGPLFESRLPDTEIWLGTMSNTTDEQIVRTVMGGPAAAYVKGIGLQWLMGDDMGSGSALSRIATDYEVLLMQTEHKCGHYPWVEQDAGPPDYPEYAAFPPAPNDFAYGVESWELIRNWITGGVNSYLAWNMVLDTDGLGIDEKRPWAQNSLLVVDRDTVSLIVTPAYYVFRHVAQYVESGAVRLNFEEQKVDGLAFRNPDGGIVVVLHNGNGQPSETTLAVTGTTLQFTVPANGWATVNYYMDAQI